MTDERGAALELAVFTGETVSTHAMPASGTITLGRADDNDVRIQHRSVSRHHAVLHLASDGKAIRIEDLGGANGTFVHDPEGDFEPGKTHDLRQLSKQSIAITVGECVSLGHVMIVLRHASEAGSAPKRAHVVTAPAMRALYEQAKLAARAPISVLLLGETGVGKEVLARAIHEASPRASKPFIGLNCAALSESLLESELFGHEKGAFTGAATARPGLFEAAEGGTVFLDEIGELPASFQVKLLRTLEERQVMRVGGRTAKTIDVRFVSATNRDLEAEIERGTFRQDLYFRLNGIAFTISPLRERTSEIAELSRSFIEAAAAKMARGRVPSLSPEALEILERYAWPGNVRELRNVIERAVVLASGDEIIPDHLPSKLSAAVATPRPEPAAAAATANKSAAPVEQLGKLKAEISALERQRIIDAIERCAGNQTQAAELLGISRRTLVTRLGELGLPRPRKRV